MSESGDKVAPGPGRRSVARVAIMTMGAIVLYGGWAYFANLGEPGSVALRAAGTQGFTSALSTLFMASLAEIVFHRFGLSRVGIIATATAPPTLTACMHAMAQWAVGTPRVLSTVALSVVMGYVVAGLYAAWLTRIARAQGRKTVADAR